MDKEKRDFQIHVLWLPFILFFGILYVISFVDLVPDVVPIFGQLDDVAVALVVLWFLTSWLPKNFHRVYWSKPHESRRRSEAGGREESRREEAKSRREEDWDPFKVLNVAPGASEIEIKHAYRELMAKYHPDKVNHLGEEFQRLAHGKVVEINKAYNLLMGKE